MITEIKYSFDICHSSLHLLRSNDVAYDIAHTNGHGNCHVIWDNIRQSDMDDIGPESNITDGET